MRATKFAMSLGVIMVLGRGKSAKFYLQALLIEKMKRKKIRVEKKNWRSEKKKLV